MTPSFNQTSPKPVDWRRHDWGGGVFETARRPFTPLVEGRLVAAEATVMVTLRGGARHHELVTDDGTRFSGPDRAGMMSFLPAGCGRRLTLRGVAWEWASLTLRPELMTAAAHGADARPFAVTGDGFVLGILTEMERLHALDGCLDAAYCDAMGLAIVQYLDRKFWRPARSTRGAAASGLPTWRLRRVADYVEAHLGDEIRIAELARLIGVSEAHFHRAFRATTGQTPLAFITGRRIEAAKRILSLEKTPVAEIAHRSGFVSASHFARTFRAATGLAPSAFRRRYRSG